eukprot:gnl/TRDRNA2_/TRDRNA2_163497_c0_seq6.p1 gnl/TRDRNA2_/TRDRNA2_163497_c0~~gnl/TRDRNA2_/TRDRNA2_163497_c0_seq6.p1  ORF type:complete len:344 (+),score=27.47 gnl/TRDRNA2_/TRDRNA2_163497_c0_seq6:47-1078(+)
MAIPSLLLATFVTVWSLPLNSDLHAQTNVDFICNKNTEGGERLLLIGDVQARLGSTALLQLLSSSPHLTNLCSANAWQCEGFRIMEKNWSVGSESSAKVENPLPSLEKHWNLSRYILFDKQFPDEVAYSNGMLSELNEAIEFRASTVMTRASSVMTRASTVRTSPTIETHNLPPRMRYFGIRSVKVAYLMMWRPLCMIAKKYVYRAGAIVPLVNQHKMLRAHGVPVVVFKYADFIWHTDALALKLIERLPCLGPLDTDYVESKVARHVNNMSTKAFGKSVSPDHYGYDDRTDTCYEETTYKGEFYMYHDTWGTRVTTRVFETVDGADIKAAETYLRSVSLSIV